MWSTVADQGKCSARVRAARRRAATGRAATSSTASASASGSGRPSRAAGASTSSRAPPTSAVTTGVPAGQRLQDGEAEGLPGADRQRDVGPGEVRGQLARGRRRGRGSGPAPSRGDLLELVAVRAGAVDVHAHRYAAAVQRDRGRDREVRALLPGQPSGVHQPQRAVVGTGVRRRRVEGLQVDAERDPVQRRARAGRRPARTRASANPEVTTTASNRRTRTRLSTADAAPATPGLPAGAQREHRVEPLVGEAAREPTRVAPGPAGHGQQRRLVRDLDRGGPEPSRTSITRQGSRISR